jgi:hypothetical protein
MRIWLYGLVVEPFAEMNNVTEDGGPEWRVSGGGRPRAWPIFASR